MVDYNIAIPGGGGSNALHPLALMALQQRGQLGEGNLAYKEQLLALKEQQINNQLAKAALSQENTAAAKKDITNAISNSVVGLPGEAAGPYLPDVNRAVNSLALGGKLGPAKTVSDFLEQQAKQRVQEGLADENAAKAKGENEKLIDTHIARYQTMSQFVDSPEKAAAFSKAMSSDPALADYAHLAGDPEEAAARNAALYTQDPVAWHTGVAKLTGEQFINAVKPKIETVGAGQNVVAVSPSGTAATSLMTTPSAPKEATMPAGYRMAANGTSMEVIPGGPADAKQLAAANVKLEPGQKLDENGNIYNMPNSKIDAQQRKAHANDAKKIETVNVATDSTLSNIDQILDPKKASDFNANFGYGSSISAKLPGARDVAAKIDNIKSALKSLGLEDFRVNGSIGAMTEKEWPIVQDRIASLKDNMSPEAARQTLADIKNRLNMMRNITHDSYDNQWGASQYYKPELTKNSTTNIFNAADAIIGGK